VPETDDQVRDRLLSSFKARPPQPRSHVSESRKSQYGRADWQELLWAYYTGNPPLPNVAKEYRQATREFLRLARANYALLIVEAMLDRLTLRGARTGRDGDVDGDDQIRKFMAENGSFFADAMTYTFSMGEGYVFVGPPLDGSKVATATAEDPRQIAVDRDPIRPSRIINALKTFRANGIEYAYLYRLGDPEDRTNDRVRIAQRSLGGKRRGWEWQETGSGDLDVQGLGLPIVPLTNRLGMGEFELHLDVVDRIMNMIADRLWTSKYQTFRQRALKGDLPDEDDDGNEINYDEVFSADPGAMWELPDGVDIWESQQATMTDILASVRDDVKELSAVSRTPLSMFTPDAAAGSAEGASLMREGITFKTEDRQTRLTPAARRVCQLGLAYGGQEQQAKEEILPVWGPAERFSLQQRGAAAVQAKTSGVPQESIWAEVWQFDPATVARMKRERAADLLFQQPGQPPAVNPPVNTDPVRG
jgi:hypothetical protein